MIFMNIDKKKNITKISAYLLCFSMGMSLFGVQTNMNVSANNAETAILNDCLSRECSQDAYKAYTELAEKPITSSKYTVFEDCIEFTVNLQYDIVSGKIILAAYDMTGKVISVDTASYAGNKYDFFVPSNTDIVKIFVWNDLSKMRPLGVVELVEISEETKYNNLLKNISNIYLTANDTRMYVYGEPIELSLPAQIINNMMYSPIRSVPEGLKWITNWYDKEQMVTFEYDNQLCSVKIGETSAVYKKDKDASEEEIISLHAAPIVLYDRVLIPYEEIIKMFGYDVYFDNNAGVFAVLSDIDTKIKYAYDNRLININKIDITSLDKHITRSEMASLSVALYEKATNNEIYVTIPSTSFVDTKDENILKATEMDFMAETGNGYFYPDNYLTYAEATTIIYKTIMAVNSNLSDKYIEVTEYTKYPTDGSHWATRYLYASKKLGVLDGIYADDIDIDQNAALKNVIGIISNSFYQLSKADETKFLYLCNSSYKYTGIVEALQSGLYRKYDKIADDIQKVQRIAQKMYKYCSYYESIEKFDEYYRKVFNELYPSVSGGGGYS